MRLLPPLILFALLWPLGPASSLADIAVIVHPESPLRALSAQEVSDLYLGRTRSVRLGEQRIPVAVLEHPTDSPLREAFFLALNNMRIYQVNAYWARLRFSGEVLPPSSLQNNRAIIDAVRHDRSAVGYVDAAAVDNSVRTVLLLRE